MCQISAQCISVIFSHGQTTLYYWNIARFHTYGLSGGTNWAVKRLLETGWLISKEEQIRRLLCKAAALRSPITGSSSINGHKKSDSRCKWGLLRHHCWRWWSLSQWAVKVWKKLKYINKYFFKNESRYGCRTNLPPEGLKLLIF